MDPCSNPHGNQLGSSLIAGQAGKRKDGRFSYLARGVIGRDRTQVIRYSLATLVAIQNCACLRTAVKRPHAHADELVEGRGIFDRVRSKASFSRNFGSFISRATAGLQQSVLPRWFASQNAFSRARDHCLDRETDSAVVAAFVWCTEIGKYGTVAKMPGITLPSKVSQTRTLSSASTPSATRIAAARIELTLRALDVQFHHLAISDAQQNHGMIGRLVASLQIRWRWCRYCLLDS